VLTNPNHENNLNKNATHMSTNERAAFNAMMKGIVRPYEVEAQPWEPHPEDYPEYAKAVMDRIDILPVPVSETVFAEHVRQVDAHLCRTTAVEIKEDLTKAKQRIEIGELNPTTGRPCPILPLSAALSAFEKLTLHADANPATPISHLMHYSPRFDAIIALVENIAEDAWKGKVIDTHSHELSTLLYDDAHEVNITVDQQKAKALATRIIDSIYEARDIFSAPTAEPAPIPKIQAPAVLATPTKDGAPMRPIQQFAERVLDQLPKVRFPVTEELFQQHLKDAQAELDETGDEDLKYELERHPIGGKPSLHYLQAISALDNLLQKDTPNAADEVTERFLDIEGATMFLARQIWLNEDSTEITRALKQLLHDPSERHNVTIGTEWATQAVRQIEKVAREIKTEMLGLGR
jgi:hypothetical protein